MLLLGHAVIHDDDLGTKHLVGVLQILQDCEHWNTCSESPIGEPLWERFTVTEVLMQLVLIGPCQDRVGRSTLNVKPWTHGIENIVD